MPTPNREPLWKLVGLVLLMLAVAFYALSVLP